MKFAVFASGNGSNLQAVIEAVKSGEIKAELAIVFSDRKKAHALKRAEEAGIKTLCLEPKNYATKQSFERAIIIHLKEEGIDFIVMAGYMRILTPFFIKNYPNKIINVHPSLLPSFKGIQGIKDTFTYGSKIAGVTIHFVDEKMEPWPIILQESVKIAEDETIESLTEKIHKLEHRIYPKAIVLLVEERLKVRGRKVHILEKPPASSHAPQAASS